MHGSALACAAVPSASRSKLLSWQQLTRCRLWRCHSYSRSISHNQLWRLARNTARLELAVVAPVVVGNNMMETPLVSLMVVVLVFSSTVTAFDGYNRPPRPSGMDDEPTANLGRTPAVNYDGKRADCIWYAWEDFHYPPEETSNCSKLLWSALSQGADASTELQGFTYYAPADQPEFYDPAYQEYFCLVGCFSLAAPPVNAPPPRNAPAAPATRSPPPAAVPPPPPATLFRPPPPSMPQPPPVVAGGSQAPGPESTQSSGEVGSFPNLLIFLTGMLLAVGDIGPT